MCHPIHKRTSRGHYNVRVKARIPESWVQSPALPLTGYSRPVCPLDFFSSVTSQEAKPPAPKTVVRTKCKSTWKGKEGSAAGRINPAGGTGRCSRHRCAAVVHRTLTSAVLRVALGTWDSWCDVITNRTCGLSGLWGPLVHSHTSLERGRGGGRPILGIKADPTCPLQQISSQTQFASKPQSQLGDTIYCI